jgi:hypothetical protein
MQCRDLRKGLERRDPQRYCDGFFAGAAAILAGTHYSITWCLKLRLTNSIADTALQCVTRDISENRGNFTEVDIRNVALEQYHTRLKSVFDGHALLS